MLSGMASDGDLFHQRQIYGFCKAYTLACRGGAAEDEAAAIVAAAQNALRRDFRIGAFRPMVAAAWRVAANHLAGLFAGDPFIGQGLVRVHLDLLERRFSELATTPEIRRIVESVAHEAMEEGTATTAGQFQEQCLARLARWLLDRLHFKPTETEVRKALPLDRAASLARQEEVFAICRPDILRLLTAAQSSPLGRPPQAKPLGGVDINSAAGLEEALV